MIRRAAGMRRLLGSSVGGSRVGVALLFVALVVAWTVAYFATAHFTLLTSPSAFALLPAGNATSRAWLQRLQSSLSVLPQQGQPPQPQHEQQENGQQSKEQEQGRQGQQKEQSAGQQSGDGRDVWDKREQKPAKQNDSASHASANELLTQEQQSQQHVGKQVDTASVDTAANDGPVAICLVGGAREFEATWPSILRHVISRYPPAHLFLHSPLDERASKLWALLLASPANATTASSAAAAAAAATNSTQSAVSTAVSIAAVRIFPSADIAVTDQHRAVLTSNGSPHGIQGLLQYFRLVEGCVDLIATHQQQHNISYRWVIRTRVDGYWTAPPPLLPSLHPSAYTIPFGFDWGGLNDRLGIGSWAASKVALRRLSALQDLFSAGYKALTSEKAFRAQMESGGVAVARKHFHFCVVTRRRSRGGDGCAAMMFSTATYGPLNGAKCRPCSSPCAVDDQVSGVEHRGRVREGEGGGGAVKHIHPLTPTPPHQAAAIINTVRAAGGMYRHPLPPGLQLCDAKQAWEGGWERQFDRDVERQRGGKTLSWQRRNIGRVAASLVHCTEQFNKVSWLLRILKKQACEGGWERQFDRGVERQRGWKTLSWQRRNIGRVAASLLKAMSVTWDSPPPVAVCIRAQLGEVELMGSKTGEFNTFTSLLTSKSTFISVTNSKASQSWERHLFRRYGKVRVGFRNADWLASPQSANASATTTRPFSAVRAFVSMGALSEFGGGGGATASADPSAVGGKKPTPGRGGVVLSASPEESRVRAISEIVRAMIDGVRAGRDVEYILMGGTFMSLPADYRDFFVRNLHDALSGRSSASVAEAVQYAEHAATRCIGLTIETRPDYCLGPHLRQMLAYGCTRLEIGVQSTYEDVARDTNRGHTVAAVADCFCLAKDAGFKVVAHMMPDLPSVGMERDMESFREFMHSPAFRTDGLKLYPTLVIRGTGLYELWKTGRYRNYPPEKLIDLVARILALVPPWTRVYRIMRDIPLPLVTSGIDKGNLRELALARMAELGLRCRDVRTREAGIQDIHHAVRPHDVQLVRRDYAANDGWETFLSYEDVTQDILVGLLRLRRCGAHVTCPELKGRCSIVRELHVYGTAVPVHTRDTDKLQHQGYGTLLMEEAERIARWEHGSRKLAVISGIGTRHYYRKLGYELEGPYMVKTLPRAVRGVGRRKGGKRRAKQLIH
ncbi:unnamed protein product [Closterium sp. NIES-65]|nr:unnamed protein product [Closterium sp. NIES-65]